jgi:transcriptional repressor NrdR
MKCPFCKSDDTRVVDSREGKDGFSVRRRRECNDCQDRFTTYERIHHAEVMMVVKKDGRREEFDRNKIINGMRKACEKRPVSIEIIEDFASALEKEFLESGEREIHSEKIGERLISKLYEIDEVAYVRFASVYRSFKDVNEFLDEVTGLLKEKK